MAKVCDLCGKKAAFGRRSRHHRGVAGRQWAKRAQKKVKVFKPNLQKTTIEGRKLTVCTKCLKLLRSAKKEENKEQTAVSA